MLRTADPVLSLPAPRTSPDATGEDSLARLLAEHRVLVHLQRQVDVRSGMTAGYEALVRGRGTRGQALGAGQVLGLVRDEHDSLALGMRVLHLGVAAYRVLQTASGLQAACLEHPPTVSVNVTAGDLADRRLAERVASACERFDVSPDRVCVELTESHAVQDVALVRSHLRRLRRLGCRTSLDDFGAGYSSLGVLSELPVDEVKLDRSLLAGPPSLARRRRVVLGATVELAHELGTRVVLEGVETPRQLALAVELDVDVVQGFLLARPEAVTDLARLARAGGPAPRPL